MKIPKTYNKNSYGKCCVCNQDGISYRIRGRIPAQNPDVILKGFIDSCTSPPLILQESLHRILEGMLQEFFLSFLQMFLKKYVQENT